VVLDGISELALAFGDFGAGNVDGREAVGVDGPVKVEAEFLRVAGAIAVSGLAGVVVDGGGDIRVGAPQVD